MTYNEQLQSYNNKLQGILNRAATIPVVQEKSINIISSGATEVLPDENHTLSKVSITTHIPQHLMLHYDVSTRTEANVIKDLSNNGYDVHKGLGHASLKPERYWSNIYSASKKLTALPLTWEAVIKIPPNPNDNGLYLGNILACYEEGQGSRIVWDVVGKTVRMFVVSYNTDAYRVVQMKFIDAFAPFYGADSAPIDDYPVHLAITLAPAAGKLYINGEKFEGTTEYVNENTTIEASYAGFYELYSTLDLTTLPVLTWGGDFRNNDWGENNRRFFGKICSAFSFTDLRSEAEILADSRGDIIGGDDILFWYDIEDLTADGKVRDKAGNGYDIQKQSTPAQATAPLSFTYGLDNLFIADKYLTAMPQTFEAIIEVPNKYFDTYEGDIYAALDTEHSNYFLWDLKWNIVSGVGATDLGLRLLFGKFNEAGSIRGNEYCAFFPTAFKNYMGQKVHAALVIGDDTIKAYINGEEITETPYCYKVPEVKDVLINELEVDVATVARAWKNLEVRNLPLPSVGGDYRLKKEYKEGEEWWDVWENDNFRYFKGKIYIIKVFSNTRTSKEIARDYQFDLQGG